MFPSLFVDREINEYRKSALTVIEEKEKYVTYGVPERHVSQLNRKVKRLDHMREGVASLPASVLMALVARYDANISGLVRFLLHSRKERLAGNERTIPVKNVLAASSFEDLINGLVDDEIHGLMRGSHEDQVRYIEDNFSIKVREGFKRWPAFIEVFERRNLVAHGEGFANVRYIRICEAANVPAEERLKFGDAVTLTDAYLRRSTDILLEFGILLVWWLWLKQIPGEAEEAYSAISDLTYELIVDKRYKLASRILESVLSRKSNDSPEIVKRMMAVNLANCYKKVGDAKSFEKALQMFDWSASADAYQISVASLKEDVEQVCNLMHRVSDEFVVGKEGFRDWPVFDWVRENEKVKIKFKEVFGEPLDLVSEHSSAGEVNELSDQETAERAISQPVTGESVH